MSTVRSLFHGFVPLNGVPTLLHENEEYDVEHPLVQARPDLFTEPSTRRQAKQQQQATGKKPSDG